MLMEEFIRKTWFFVEEDQGSEVGLLVGAFSNLEFVESKTMGKVTRTFYSHIDGFDFSEQYFRLSSIACLYMALNDAITPLKINPYLAFMMGGCWAIPNR